MGKQKGITLRALSLVGIASLVLVGAFVAIAGHAHAQATEEGFSLQVSPSPLVATVQPGADRILELQIRNTNTTSQALKMDIRSFDINSTSGEVKLNNTVSPEIRELVSFESPKFTLAAGEIFTQRIHVHPGVNTGFSYNFALVVSQQNPPKVSKGKSAIAGSVAVFTLINVDKPGAVRKFELKSVAVGRHSYEYLPADISVTLKNTGNTNVQPSGTIFIQRNSSDSKPIAMLPLNNTGGYVLPGVNRTFSASWTGGFPHFETTETNGKKERRLVWQGGFSNLRIGRYVAKVVAIYDDGQRDIPATAEVSFWVIPWKLLLAALLIVIILIVGITAVIRMFLKAVGKTSNKLKSVKHRNRQSDD